MDTETLAHTKWNCKYHIVFAPCTAKLILYTQGVEMGQDIIVLGT